MRVLSIAIMVLALAACTQAQNTSNEAARVSKDVVDDTRNAWRDLFTYRKPRQPQEPQTRYCYQMQSDIACYDMQQTNMTSKLVGYQDGQNISYIRQGGGAFGMSSVQSEIHVPLSPYPEATTVISSDMGAPMQTGNDIAVQDYIMPPTPSESGCVAGSSPFNCKESNYVPGVDVGH